MGIAVFLIEILFIWISKVLMSNFKIKDKGVYLQYKNFIMECYLPFLVFILGFTNGFYTILIMIFNFFTYFIRFGNPKWFSLPMTVLTLSSFGYICFNIF